MLHSKHSADVALDQLSIASSGRQREPAVRVQNFGMLYMLLFAIMSSGCSFPNPRDCEDGTCTDPGRPFCDVDGSISGFNLTCIAVSCIPMEFATCRGDQVVRCNGAGTNYDLVTCPLGCDAAADGCRECSDDRQCGNPRPVCDLGTSSCRGCRSDDECPSKVCDIDAGSCLAEGSVVYASADGLGRCVLSQPCQLEEAIDLAIRSGTVTIRMLSGIYQKPLDVRIPNPQQVTVVGTGATIVPGSSPAIVVRDGANVAVRGLATTAVSHVDCGAAGSTLSRLALQDVSFTTLGNVSGTISTTRCSLIMTSTSLSLNAAQIALSIGDDSELLIDRLHIHGDNNPHIATPGSRNVTMRMTNSLLEDVLLDLNTADISAPGSSFAFAFNTFADLSNSLDVGITSSTHRTIYFENNIIVTRGTRDAVIGTNCGFSNTLVFPQESPPAGTFVQAPGFVDIAARNFRLLPDSPAVDAASPATQGLSAELDLDGTRRPQGARPDIGAYELARGTP
jgi:hypothetical protein